MAPATGEMDTKKAANEFSNQMSSGVKALVDSGVTKIPKIFHYPQDDLPNQFQGSGDSSEVPVIDLEDIHGQGRSVAVEEIRKASEEWGFFQIVNHGIPQRVLDEMLQGVRRFHEETEETQKNKLVTQDPSSKIRYCRGTDSFESKVSWKDTLACSLTELDSTMIPLVCREILVEYSGWIAKVRNLLCELFSEALGLNGDCINLRECINGLIWGGNYYPACPEPHMTFGVFPHKDDSSFTILLQDEIGGLQVLNQNLWKDVTPIKGALTINVGAFLQVMSNDKFKSVVHRALAKSIGPRISVVVFITTEDINAKVIGPIKQLLSENDPPIYRKFSVAEYLNFSLVDPEYVLPHFKL